MLLSLKQYSSRPLFKTLSTKPGEIPAWSTVTCAEFHQDIENVAAHWTKTLAGIGIQPNSVVGLWITGTSYQDPVQLFGLVRAGYVPQLFSHNTPFQVIIELLAFTKGKALLYDPGLSDHVADLGLPAFPCPASETIAVFSGCLPDLPAVNPTDTVMIFHSSGTTSGKPKPIPQKHGFLSSFPSRRTEVWKGDLQTPSMLNNIGSFAHILTSITVIYLAAAGSCLIQSPRPDFDAAELTAMVNEGLNHLQLYGPWLSRMLDIARDDSKVLGILQSLVQIAYTGAAMSPENEKWVVENKIPVTVVYATTETGPCLVSDFGDNVDFPLMRLTAPQAQMIPADIEQTDLDGDSSSRFQGRALYDLFIPDTAPNCPDPLVRNRSNGHVTGDLFEEVKPGLYAYRGRNDDWIKTGKNRFFCDTKSIEDNLLRICPDLVQQCVVVGHYKPAPVLLVEPIDVSFNYETGSDALKEEILKRTLTFNERVYPHEQIRDPSRIVIIKTGSLPRTAEKGNIRRNAAQEQFREILEQIYTSMVAE
ncbi:acetyl-CoA synthetase-like protein [Mycena floridula]|nr:acetyl-CoA synthetase-like protein [Mycena floridula]